MKKTIYGLTGAAKLHYAYEMAKAENRQLLYITFNEIERAKAHIDLSSFMEADTLESRSIQFMESDIRSGSGKRIEAMIGAIEGTSIVASIDALLPYLAPKEEFEKSVLHLERDMEIELEDLRSRFLAMGYERSDMVQSHDQFAIRGDIVDIGCGYRIELFDNVIYSIKKLDMETQLSKESVNRVRVLPVVAVPVFSYDRLYRFLSEEYDKRSRSISASDSKMASRLERYINSIDKGIPFADMDNFAYYAYEKPASLFDYMDNPIVVFDDYDKVQERIDSLRENYTSKFTAHFQKGQSLIFHENCLNFNLAETLGKAAIDFKEFINIDAGLLINTKNIFYKPSMGEEFFEFIRSGKDYKTYVFCGSDNRAERFIEMLRERDIGAFYSEHFEDMDFGRICVLPLPLSGSVEYTDRKIRLISDQVQQKKKQKQRSAPEVFTDINAGDYVVHDVHGIGKYLGIKSVTSMKKTRDYLAIEYRDGGMLYLPTEQMDRLQKYVGTSELPPRLSKIGGKEWKKVKEKVSKNVEDMAEDLVRLYAQRASRQGYAFSQDTPWQQEFEDSFEYEDTPDQAASIKEIKADMESGMIMDRLLCGDVGYGKTEVAIRAMFKCVTDGKQAAMLAPTVVLAKQHYNTVCERLKGYPVKVGLLSRFSSSKEIKEIEKALKEGEIDIIIGTHKLLGKSVQYKDLGLLVVDEEQRFGVKHKEQIKLLKNSVDVLTLSATPIPRTLYMSLIGIRDISVINTPPLLRQTVATYVMEYNPDLVVDAINDEIERGGQVYFLYNDVSSIDAFGHRLSQSLPNVSVDIGHGQMSKDRLDKVMLDFYSGKTQVLLCSTIIESGLDVTNANTIIVYDADRFGLSQLYQLRGRVGRGEAQAYAYFTYRGNLTEKAHKRLSAIKDFTEFGSGFKIAMRDLEIRGAGNILGNAQSGNMAAVGYDMYCRLIQGAVNKIRGTEEEQAFETAIKLDIDAFIPDSYIGNEDVKIDVYKRIAEIDCREAAEKIADELADRFGKLPMAVLRLLDVAVLKALCQRVRISAVEQMPNGIVLKLDEQNKIDNEKLLALMTGHKFTVEKDYKIRIQAEDKNEEGMIGELITFIESAECG